MKQCVLDALPAFTDRFEGKLLCMYLDVEGLVTTGRGNLIDSPAAANALEWWVDGGRAAAAAAVAAEWSHVKSLQSMRMRGGKAFEAVTRLRLTPDFVDALTRRVAVANDVELLRHFQAMGSWPADAQLAAHSMAWAAGPAFARGFPHFCAAVNASPPEFSAAAGAPGNADVDLSCRGHAWLRDGAPGQAKADQNPGLRPRNLENKRLFEAAAAVLASGGDPDVLTPA